MSSKHHEIEITLAGKKALPPKPIPDLEVGDTVHYFFKGAGRVTITFPELSPYRTDQQTNGQVTDGQTLTVQRTGRFRCGCLITLPTGESIGWDPADPQANLESGGEHHVKK